MSGKQYRIFIILEEQIEEFKCTPFWFSVMEEQKSVILTRKKSTWF